MAGSIVAESPMMAESAMMAESESKAATVTARLVTPVIPGPAEGILADYEPTIYTVRFTPKLAKEHQAELRKRTKSVERFRAWATFITNQLTQKKIDEGKLPNGNTPADQFAVGAYRSKVMDTVYTRRAPWLSLNAAVNNFRTLSVKSTEFRKEIVSLALVGFQIPLVAMASLDKVLDAVVASISSSRSSEVVGNQYWIQFILYDFNPMIEEVTTRIRTISFMTTSTTYDVAKNCTRSKESNVSISFTGSDKSFNFDIYDAAGDAMTEKQKRDAENALKDDPSFDVEV